MNPLAAIRQFLAPEYRPLEANPAAERGSVAAAIPAAELKTLAPAATDATRAVGATGAPGAGTFGNLLGDLVSEVNGKRMAAAEATQGVLTGQSVSLHQAVIAMEEASISFQLMVEVRNKLLESYQELMRMQV